MPKNPLIRSYPKKVNAPLQKKSAGILDDHAVRKNIATKEGSIEQVPVNDNHIVNKLYVDDKLVESFPTSLTAGSVVFSDGTNLSQDNFNLFWDSANNRLEPNLLKITSDGTQASPALKFNDTNTGFYKSGDSVSFSLNNSTKMTIDETGVGIGVTDPDVPLEVNGNITLRTTGNHTFFMKTTGLNTVPRFIISNDTRTWVLTVDGADQDKFKIKNDSFGTTPLTIDAQATGNVGISTTSPDTKLQVVGDVKFGDDNTNYVTIDATGNLVFVGGAGLAFGEIYARDNTTTTSTSTTKAQILIFDTDGESNNMTAVNAQGHLVVTKPGKYKIDTSISIKNSSGSAHVINVEMYKNNGSVVFNNIHAGRNLGTGSDVGNLTMSGIVDLAVNDTIEIWITSDSGAARTITIEDIDFSAIQVGGT